MSSSSPSVAGLRRQRVRLALVALIVLAMVVVLAGLADEGHSNNGTAPGADGPSVAGDAAGLGLHGPILTEVMSSNGSTLQDADGDYPDWIEIHNPTDEPLELTGYHLSDDDDEPDRWRLPEVELEAGGFLVVFASGKDRAVTDGELHTDFRMAQGDEPTLLVGPDGQMLIDRLPAVEIPRDASFGRDPADLQRICWFALPTPGETNAPACFDDLDLGAPALSAPTGFYDKPFDLVIEPPYEGAEVLYTTDGSYPDLVSNRDRTQIYQGPVRIEDRTGQPPSLATIDTIVSGHPFVAERAGLFSMPDLDDVRLEQASVIRARTVNTAESRATYFVGEDRRREQLAVVSLFLDPDHLFDYGTDIYVPGRTFDDWRASDDYDPEARWDIPTNYNQRGRDWERPFRDELHNAVIFDYCRPGGDCAYQREVGVRIHGGASRTFPQKSLRLYARNDYGDRRFRAPVFGDQAPDGHRRLILRNSGNDNGLLMFKDAFLQSLMRDLTADTQAYQPAVVFINGEYWGIQNLRERYDHHYLEVVHGADPARVEILDNTSGPLEGDVPRITDDWETFLAELEGLDPTTAGFRTSLESEVDVDSFFDFIIAHTFAGNADSISNNARWWREPDGPDQLGEGPRDGRWRWLISDLDQSGGRPAGYDPSYDLLADRLVDGAVPADRDGIPFLFNRMLANDELREHFLNRFATLFDTAFHPERTVPALEQNAERLREEIDQHALRWRRNMLTDWERRVADLEAFLEERPGFQRQQLIDRFELEATSTVTVDASGPGSVEIARVDVAASGASWQGTYFTGIPVTLRAVPHAGNRFVRWEGTAAGTTRDPVLVLPAEGDAIVTAVFEGVNEP